MMDEVTEILPTDWKPENSMIKVIGVGGGGCNAVTYMYNQKIQGCSFIVCNTDSQALEKAMSLSRFLLETVWAQERNRTGRKLPRRNRRN